MQSLLVFLAVGALSVLASNRRLLDAGRLFALAQLSSSGLLFLAFGVLLGPRSLALVTGDDVLALRPLVALGLGLGGLMMGLNLDLRVLRRLPGAVYRASLMQSGLGFLVVAVPLAGVLYATGGFHLPGAIGAAALLGAAASVSSGHLAVLWSRTGRLDRGRGLSVALLAMLDDLLGVLVLAVALAIGAAVTPGAGLGLVGLAALVGLACGALIAYLAHGLSEGPELGAVLLGGLALVSGAAAYLRISAL
ncbi:MAG: cation:proton antiporter domain-containing protein, partial [Myxococcaceae bacterium]